MSIKKSKNISKTFGKNLKMIRIEKQMSQGDIARTLGVHRSYISGLEGGVRNPTLTNIERIARALDIDIGRLLA